MSRSEMSGDGARKELYDIMQRDLSFSEKAEQALALGQTYLGVQNGHLTRIDTESDYWKTIASTDPADGQFPPGLILDLSTTYCRRTVENESVAVYDAPNQGWANDPAYDAHGLDTYHGTALIVDDEPYGTVCFVSDDARDEAFSEEQTMFAELISRMLEHELRHRRTLEQIDRLEQFTQSVCHDLRNPLQVAQGRIEVEQQTRGDSEQLRTADRALDRMQEIVTDILTLARQGRDASETEPVSLSSLVTECWQSIEADAPRPQVVDDYRFRADPQRTKQLFENLFRNALEHGGEDVTLRVGQLPSQSGFYVEDSGSGIPPDIRDEVFETGTSTGDDGMGLGLAIVEGVVSAHEWTIRVTEGSDGGARFEIAGVITDS